MAKGMVRSVRLKHAEVQPKTESKTRNVLFCTNFMLQVNKHVDPEKKHGFIRLLMWSTKS